MGRRRIAALPIPMPNPQYGASSLSGRHGVQYWFGWLLVHWYEYRHRTDAMREVVRRVTAEISAFQTSDYAPLKLELCSTYIQQGPYDAVPPDYRTSYVIWTAARASVLLHPGY